MIMHSISSSSRNSLIKHVIHSSLSLSPSLPVSSWFMFSCLTHFFFLFYLPWRFLDHYEKIQLRGVEVDDAGDLDDDGGLGGSRRLLRRGGGGAQLVHSVPLSYNHAQHLISGTSPVVPVFPDHSLWTQSWKGNGETSSWMLRSCSARKTKIKTNFWRVLWRFGVNGLIGTVSFSLETFSIYYLFHKILWWSRCSA